MSLARRPKLGFLGVGWIGRNRMEAVLQSGAAEVVAIADPSAEMRAAAQALVPGARVVERFEALLEQSLDGVVIATPSAQHAEQCERALERGLHVFCQKPLGRTAAETLRVVRAAERADRLLGVDFSYRYTEGLRRIRELIAAGELGQVYALNVVFHNAYGPDKPWFYDRASSGGGALIDLGVHLVDGALHLLDFPQVEHVTSRLYAQGRVLPPNPEEVEDYAVARLDLQGGATVELACSWRLPAGQDAVIGVSVYGTGGGAALRNVNGSFYDFVAERFRGTSREVLAEPPDAWGGRAVVDWAERLGREPRFTADALSLVRVAEVVDRIYGRPVEGAGSTVARPAREEAGPVALA